MIKNKKGISLNEGFGAILMLVVIATLVIVGILVFVSLIDGPFTGVAGTSTTVTNEVITPPALVNNATACGFAGFAIDIARNASGTLIPAANYTTTAVGELINTTALAGTDAAPWTINYTHTTGSAACDASQAMIVQFATYPALVGLVGTILLLGLVIGVLVASFVFGGKRV